MSNRKIRVLLAKVGLDGHDVGVKIVAKALADAGMEVIYTGMRQRPETVVDVAIQEDVDFIGISILSGSHMVFFPEILRLLKEKDAESIYVFGGGVIPIEDIETLLEMGVKAIHTSGRTTQETVDCVRELYAEKHSND